MKKYYAMEKNGNEATITIYGDITSYPWSEEDVSAYNLSKQLDALGDVSQINVYINSYGGEVAEGLAIYNALKRHKAKVTTYCDGFACSIASVIFMAGDERVMSEASLLMIHNAWTWAAGNSQELRKQADDLEKITQASVEAYKAHSTLSEEEIKALMDAESWILPEEAIEYGFATSIVKTEKAAPSQSVKTQLIDIVKAYQEAKDEKEPDTKKDEADDDSEGGDNGTDDNPDDESDNDSDNDSEKDNDDSGEDDESDDDEEITAQKWSGFFNAISKM